ncbi:hypothetical protein BK140_16645 [Paenibacillus macerans]|nr:hypothetical protein BK140_16645 [Paenibacillus macerans]
MDFTGGACLGVPACCLPLHDYPLRSGTRGWGLEQGFQKKREEKERGKKEGEKNEVVQVRFFGLIRERTFGIMK